MKLEEITPPKPGKEEILINVKAAGVNPVDTYIRSGKYLRLPELPYTPGYDAAGTIEAVGEGIERFKVGDRVFTARNLSGAYAEKVLCHKNQVFPLPEKVFFQQGAALGVPYGTAYRALFQRAKAVRDEVVLIHGATGGVGIAAVQLARNAGMTVIGTGGSEKGRKLVKEQGADHVLDHHAPDYLDKILKITGGRGVDVILEMLANQNLGKDLTLLARNGRVVVIGSRGKVEIDPRETMVRDSSILGMTLLSTTDPKWNGLYAAICSGLSDGSLSPVVGKEMALREAPVAHHEVIESKAFGKIVLVP